MLKTNITGETMIFKNDKGLYSTSLSQKKQDGSYDNAYITVNFKKGVELENKTLINIKNGWLSFSKYQKEDTGKMVTVWRIFVSDFEIPGEASNSNDAEEDYLF